LKLDPLKPAGTQSGGLSRNLQLACFVEVLPK